MSYEIKTVNTIEELNKVFEEVRTTKKTIRIIDKAPELLDDELDKLNIKNTSTIEYPNEEYVDITYIE